MNQIIDQLKRQARVTDMMVTMHSIEKYNYSSKALFVDILLILSSAILTIFIYFDYNLLQSLGVNIENAKTILNVSSIATFLLSLISLTVDWKGKSEKHEQACNQLTRLKDDYRILLSDQDNLSITKLSEQTNKYNQLFSMLPKISDQKFNRYKLSHKKKIELSKLIDQFPGANIWVLKIKLSYIFNMKALKENIKNEK